MAETTLDIIIKAVDKASDEFAKVEKSADKMTAGLGKFTTLAKGAALGGVTALAAGVTAVGVKAFDMAMQYDDAMDQLVISTGKGGAELDAMGETVQRLYGGQGGRQGRGLQDIAEVVGLVAARTKASGPALEEYTDKIFQLSNLTGTDAASNVETLTRLMGAFNVPLAEAGPLMDTLFVASQKTGIPLEDMMANLESAAPIASAFNLSIAETAGLLATLEANGVPAGAAVTGLRTLMVKLDEEGIAPTRDSLGKLVEDIKGPDGLTIAVDFFGARAGPAFFQLIRDGKLDVDNLTAVIGGEGGMVGALDDATQKTEGWKESWETSMHAIDLALIPVGERFKVFLDDYMPRFTTWFSATVPAAIGKALDAIDKFMASPFFSEFMQNPEVAVPQALADWARQSAEDRPDTLYGNIARRADETFADYFERVASIERDRATEWQRLETEGNRMYPQGGGSVPIRFDPETDTFAQPGVQPRMVVGYSSGGGIYTEPYNVQVNIYGNATTTDVAEGIQQGLQGQGVR